LKQTAAPCRDHHRLLLVATSCLSVSDAAAAERRYVGRVGMRFFFSGEVDVAIAETFRAVRVSVERTLNAFCDGRDYGPAVSEIGIIPIVLRPEFMLDRKERRLFQRNQHSADYRLIIDFARFLHGTTREQELLLVRNVIDSVLDLGRKTGEQFRSAELARDIANLFQVPSDDAQSS
jgi:hypothetical protein